MSFSLKLLGGLALTGEHGLLSGPAVQRHRLALLAVLATARPRAVSRDKLMAWLWPERDAEPARRLLNQAVHALRQTLGADAILSAGADLLLDGDIVRCDVVAFEDALAAGELERAVALYTGPFLDGFFLSEAPELERWADRERDRLSAAWAKAMEGLAEAAERAEDWSQAAERWKARAAHDPYDSRLALRFMRSLERAGNRAGALQHAAQHERLLREELNIEPGPEVRALVERLRREPASASPPHREPAAESRPKEQVDPSAPAPALPVTAASAVQPPPSADLHRPPRRRILSYATAAIVLAATVGSAVYLGARSRETAIATPPQVVDDIARAVARELDRRERGDTGRPQPHQRTRSIPAYELYLRGNDPTLLRSDSGARRALDYFRRAVALDSTYAAAWAGLARMLYRTSDPHLDSLANANVLAEAAVRKALALDDSLGEAHATLAILRSRAYDYGEAELHFKRAVALDPTRARIREWVAQFYLWTERPVEALAEAERASALDPYSPSATAEVARALAANDRCDEALARLRTIAALDPPLLRAAAIAAVCHDRQGRWAEAMADLRPLMARGDAGTLALFGYISARAGQRDSALAIQARLLERWRGGATGAYFLAYVPAALGDRDQAFAWLDKAYEDRSLNTPVLVGLPGTLFDALRPDPRVDQVRARLGFQNR